MSSRNDAAARILAAHERHCADMAAALAAARSAGAPAAELADLEAQELAARKRYQELAVDMPGRRHGSSADQLQGGRRPWWRFW